MPWSSEHTKWLKKISTSITTSDGKKVTLLEFSPDLKDIATIAKWAKHFRNHYCFDDDIDILKNGTGYSRKEYLEKIKFPSSEGFGPAIKAGDFGEILVADYIQFILGYSVPRTRY